MYVYVYGSPFQSPWLHPFDLSLGLIGRDGGYLRSEDGVA